MTRKTRQQVVDAKLKEHTDGSFSMLFTLEDGTKGKMGPEMLAGTIDVLQKVLYERETMDAALEAKGLTQKEKH